MKRRSTSDLKAEMNRLMQEHIESLGNQTFVTLTEEQLHKEEERLRRIRELSADYLTAIKNSAPAKMEGERIAERPSAPLPGEVEKMPEPSASEMEGDDDPLYDENRSEKSLEDKYGQQVQLKEKHRVDISVETDDNAASFPPERPRRAS